MKNFNRAFEDNQIFEEMAQSLETPMAKTKYVPITSVSYIYATGDGDVGVVRTKEEAAALLAEKLAPGMNYEDGFLLAWANAFKSNTDTFKYQNKVYQTASGAERIDHYEKGGKAKEMYVQVGLLVGLIVGVVGSKIMKGGVCLSCAVVACVAGGAIGYFAAPKAVEEKTSGFCGPCAAAAAL